MATGLEYLINPCRLSEQKQRGRSVRRYGVGSQAGSQRGATVNRTRGHALTEAAASYSGKILKLTSVTGPLDQQPGIAGVAVGLHTATGSCRTGGGFY